MLEETLFQGYTSSVGAGRISIYQANWLGNSLSHPGRGLG